MKDFRKEYRIVATKTMHFLSSGRIEVKENIPPYMAGFGSYSMRFEDIESAKTGLDLAVKDMKDWEDRHNAEAQNNMKYGVIVHWTNIHLESRVIYEWEEVE